LPEETAGPDPGCSHRAAADDLIRRYDQLLGIYAAKKGAFAERDREIRGIRMLGRFFRGVHE
jgi:hypothetical protein